MQTHPLIDVRRVPDFLAGHPPGAAGFPLEELPNRVHELPPRETRLRVVDRDAGRARQAAALLRKRGHAVTIVPFDPAAATEAGPSRVRLWRPNTFLEEALPRIDAVKSGSVTSPRLALDVACGTGRDAVYLALAGYEVDAVDVLPDALGRAADLARRCGVSISTSVRDLERDPTLSAERYDLVTVFRYLHRDLFPALRSAVKPGGFIVYETFHQRNRETGRPPTRAEHLLPSGELAAAFAGWEVLIAGDEVQREGRYYSHLLARKPL